MILGGSLVGWCCICRFNVSLTAPGKYPTCPKVKCGQIFNFQSTRFMEINAAGFGSVGHGHVLWLKEFIFCWKNGSNLVDFTLDCS